MRRMRGAMNDQVSDVFICYAAEDEAQIGRQLADKLQSSGLSVCRDEFSLKLGDGLRQAIDRGLSRSRFGVVVLSPHFFEKHWPQEELDALAIREVNGTSLIIPVRHNVAYNDVREFSPTLADRVAVTTGKGLSQVVAKTPVRREINDIAAAISPPFCYKSGPCFASSGSASECWYASFAGGTVSFSRISLCVTNSSC
jgi:TIR domain